MGAKHRLLELSWARRYLHLLPPPPPSLSSARHLDGNVTNGGAKRHRWNFAVVQMKAALHERPRCLLCPRVFVPSHFPRPERGASTERSSLEERERRQRTSDVPLHTRTCSTASDLTPNGSTSKHMESLITPLPLPSGSDPESHPESCSPKRFQDEGATGELLMWMLLADLSSA